MQPDPEVAERTVRRAFIRWEITYAVTNPHGRWYCRIDFFDAGGKVGQMLFGSAIAPGSFVGEHNGEEIHMYFPEGHLPIILELLRDVEGLSLFGTTRLGVNELAAGGLSNSQGARVM